MEFHLLKILVEMAAKLLASFVSYPAESMLNLQVLKDIEKHIAIEDVYNIIL